MPKIPTIIMLPPAGGAASSERWMAGARLAAAKDLLARLNRVDQALPIYVLAAEESDREALGHIGAVLLEPESESFHFGQSLAAHLPENARRLAYFGGASAPLMTKAGLSQIYSDASKHGEKSALVNNRHSTDWMLVQQPHVLKNLVNQLPKDNALGWVLEHSADYTVAATPPSAATRCDIDTPADVCMIVEHPAAGKHLRAFVEANPVKLQDRCQSVLTIMQTQASSMALIGRTSAEAWQKLVRDTKIWVRVFAEERGMMASGRMARGEVRSLIAAAMDSMGEPAFMQELESSVNAVLWDTRIWMAHHHIWPDNADRFAADLGWVDQIKNADLKRLTEAQMKANIPMVCGGHGVVSGGLYALLERFAYQPSKNGTQSS